MEITGHEAVLAMLKTLSTGTDKQILRPALKIGGAIILKAAKTEAPVITGTLRDDLHDWLRSRRGTISELVGGSKATSGDKGWYLPFVINGHKYRQAGFFNKFRRIGKHDTSSKSSKANDFLTRAFNASVQPALDATMAEIERRINKLKAKQAISEA
jgi:hypothetical protein